MTKSVIMSRSVRRRKVIMQPQKAGRAVAVAAWDANGRRMVLTLSQTPPAFPTGLWTLEQGDGPDAGKLVFELHQD